MNRNNSSSTVRKHNYEYFVPRDDLGVNTIQADICKYLGDDATLRVGYYNDVVSGRSVQGYYIATNTQLTVSIIESIRNESSTHRIIEKAMEIIAKRKQAKKDAACGYHENGGSNPEDDYWQNDAAKQQFGLFLTTNSTSSTPEYNYTSSYPTQPAPYSVDPASRETSYKGAVDVPPSYDTGVPKDLKIAPFGSFVKSKNDSKNFNQDVKILDADENWVIAAALLDTQCHGGNWISKRLVQRLGKLSSVSTDFLPPQVFEVSGRQVTAAGEISLRWKWHPRGSRIHDCTFYILPNSRHLDILFGVEYIVSEDLVRVNESAICPLVEHKSAEKGDKDAIAIAKERQRQEKAALKERRRQAQQDGNQQGGYQQGGDH